MEPEYLRDHRVKNLLAWEKNIVPPPTVLDIRITEKCNLKCLFCEKSIKSKKGQLSEKKLLEIIKEGAKMGVKNLDINGSGETFIRKKVALKMMKQAKAYSMEGYFVSNGTLLEDKDIQEIVKIQWDRISISLDAPDAKTHDYLRGINGAFKRTLNTLILFRYYQKRLGINKPEIIIATVLTNKNYNKIFELLKLIKTLELTTLRLQPLQKRTEICSKLKLSSIQEKKFISNLENLENYAIKNNIRTNLSFFYEQLIMQQSFKMGDVLKEEVNGLKGGLLPIYCLLPWYYIGIREEGYVEPCPGSAFEMENIKNKSLNEIWAGRLFNDFRKRIRGKKFYSFCKTCCGTQILEIKQLKKKLANYSKDE